MNKVIRNIIICFGLAIIISSCESASQYYFSIDYMEPAKMIFPARIEHLTILDNIQDSDLANKSENLQYLKTSSSDIFSGFISALAATDYFKQITIADSKWKTTQGELLSTSTFEKIGKNIDTDAIISFEQIQAKDENVMVYNSNPGANYFISIHPFFQIYNTSNKKINSFQQKDTINLSEVIFYSITMNGNNKDKYENYHLSAEYNIGKSLANNFAPHWASSQRMIYTDSPTFIHSFSCFNNEKLDEAISENISIYNKDKNAVIRVKAAYNIATLYELKDQLEDSEEWINKSLLDAKNHYGLDTESITEELLEKKPYYFYTLIYSKIIKERIKANLLLDQQMEKFIK